MKEIYSVVPRTLLKIINKDNEIDIKILEIPKLLIYYADNPVLESPTMFEKVIEDAMNLFYDVRAKKWLIREY